MELRDVLTKRRSIRKYSKRAVSGRKLRRLYKALQIAPSGGNKQNYTFIFVTDAQKRRQIAEQAGHQEFLTEAPVLMVAVCEPGGGFDVAIAADHMILAATDAGLGTCWVGWFEREPVKRILGIPDSKEVPILVTIGHPLEKPGPRERKSLEELIMHEEYQGT